MLLQTSVRMGFAREALLDQQQNHGLLDLFPIKSPCCVKIAPMRKDYVSMMMRLTSSGSVAVMDES